MSDEKKEEKRHLEQEPPKPWLIKQLEKIQEGIEAGKKFPEIQHLFEELFDRINTERYSFIDKEAQAYLLYLREINQPFAEKIGRDIAPFLIRDQYLLPLYKIAYSTLASDIWKLWRQKANAKDDNDRYALDSLALDIFTAIDKKTINEIRQERWYEGDFQKLVHLGETVYFSNPIMLKKIGIVLGKTGDSYMSDIAMTFAVRAQTLWVKEELKKETQEEVKALIEESEKSFVQKATEITDEKTKPFDEKVKGVEARFIQIIGIFAAIIAFIVTIVPTAVRLGGASIPIALAGLAIVTAGIILLLAMIFGEQGNREKVGKWLVLAVVPIFGAWLLGTIALAIWAKDTLVGSPETSKVESIYQYQPRVDTVYIVDTTKTTKGK